MAEEQLEENVADGMEQENNSEQTENKEEADYVSAEEFKRLQEEKEKVASYLEKANKEARDYRLKAKAYEEAGMSPEEIMELRQKQEKQKEKELERKGEWDKLKSQLQEGFEQEKQQYEQKLQNMQKTLERNLVQKEVTSAISKHDGITSLLQPHVERAVQLVEDDNGDLVPRVVDPDGSPKFNSKGEYMSVDEYVASMKEHEDFGLAFRGRGQSGGGTKNTGGAGMPAGPKKNRSDMSQDEKRAYITKNGIDEYNKLPL